MRMYDDMTRKTVRVLAEAGVCGEAIEAATGVSVRTVRRIVAGEDGTQQVTARVGRPSKVGGFTGTVAGWLASDPKVSTLAILERLREVGYTGGKSAVYELVRDRRPTGGELIARFEGLPGEFSQHDFGETKVRYQDGSVEKIQFFVSRLKYSRMLRVLLVPDQRTESLCDGLVDAFRFFGGVPLLSVFDNPKTIVASRQGSDVVWNRTFRTFCEEAGIEPTVTWPYSPQEKGAVENGVGFVKSSFFKVHQFRDRTDLEARLAKWHETVNDERPCRATGEVPRVRAMLEASRLRPLKIGKEGFRLRFPRQVRTDGFCEFDGIRYFVGKKWIGQMVNLRVGKSDVRIHVDGQELAHPRHPENRRRSVLPSQHPELLEKRGARPYVKRDFLIELCPAATWVITEIRHRRPDEWTRHIDRAYELLLEYGEGPLRAALMRMGQERLVGVEYLEAILLGHAQVAAVTP